MSRRRIPRNPLPPWTGDPPPTYDVIAFIMDFEAGPVKPAQLIEGFQHLLEDGLCWKLGGEYARIASDLLAQKKITPKKAR